MLVDKVIARFEDSKNEYIEILKELVAIPSVSFPGFDQEEVRRCGKKVAQLLESIGLNNVKSIEVNSNSRPYIYADWMRAPGKPTLLLYAHYDVQPPGQKEKWLSSAYELTERDGRLYGRGAADDKGGFVLNLAAIDCWLKETGELPVNIKVLIEGEEEVGSPELENFLKEHNELVQADVIIIPDVENFDKETPGLTVALRGIVSAEIEIKALKQSLHSGMWGGPLPDPAMALSKVLSSLVNEKGEINIPEINEMVEAKSEKDLEKIRSLHFDNETFRKEAGLLEGVEPLVDPKEYREHIWFKPSLNINAIQASSREQAGNIICDKAWAKVGVRTVPKMDKEKVFQALKAHVEKNCPWGLKPEVKDEGLGDWWQTSTDHPVFESMTSAMKESWGKEPVLMGCGGSIPFVQTFSDALGGAPALLIGVEDPETLAHSENESMYIKGWENSVKSCIRFFGMMNEAGN